MLPAPDGLAEIWHVVLTRPNSAHVQALVVFVENEPCGSVVVGASLGAPGALEAVRRPLADLPPDERPVEPLAADELTRRLREALAHMERHEVPLERRLGRFCRSSSAR